MAVSCRGAGTPRDVRRRTLARTPRVERARRKIGIAAPSPMIAVPAEEEQEEEAARRAREAARRTSKSDETRRRRRSPHTRRPGPVPTLVEREKMEINNWERRRPTGENVVVILGYLFGVTLAFFVLAIACNALPSIAHGAMSSIRDNRTLHLLREAFRLVRSHGYCLTL